MASRHNDVESQGILCTEQQCVKSKGSPSSSPGNCHQENPLHQGPGGEKLILSQVLLELLWKKKKTFYIGVSLQECVIREQEEIFYADKSFCRRVINLNIPAGRED